MLHETFHLKELYPQLTEISNDPTLTTYLPDPMAEMGWENEKYSAILVCPGGGYSWCSQREDEVIALKLMAMGYRVFVLNYSCAPCHFPAQVSEVAAAMELIHTNAKDWNVDIDRIGIMGFSAGGHLAGHYSNCFDCAEVRSLFPDSKAVKASILCYPVITALPEYRHEGTIQNVSGHKNISDEDIRNFSLERLVTDKTPPAFIWHTTEDDVVPVANSLLYANALAQKKIPFDLHIFTHGRHGLSTVDEMTCDNLTPATRLAAQWLPMLQAWLNAIL